MKQLILTILMIFATSLGAAKAYIDHQLNVNLERWKHLVIQEMKVDYQQIYSSLGGSIIIEQLSLTPSSLFPVYTDKIIFHKAYQLYPVPQDLSFSIRGVSISTHDLNKLWKVDESLIERFRQAGYSSFLADITLDTHLKDARLSTFLSIDASKWGKLEISLDLDQVPPFTHWTSPMRLSQFLLVSLKLNYFDQGLVNQLFAQWTQYDRTATLEDLKQTVTRQMVFYFGKDNQEKLHQFIENPKILSIQWQPPIPFALQDIWNTFPKDLKVM